MGQQGSKQGDDVFGVGKVVSVHDTYALSEKAKVWMCACSRARYYDAY